MGKEGYRRVDLFDMENVKEKKALNNLLRSDNVHDYHHELITTPLGGCKILLWYRINNPGKIDPPPDEHVDVTGNS